MSAPDESFGPRRALTSCGILAAMGTLPPNLFRARQRCELPRIRNARKWRELMVISTNQYKNSNEIDELDDCRLYLFQRCHIASRHLNKTTSLSTNVVQDSVG
jgi:hypothetical protein